MAMNLVIYFEIQAEMHDGIVPQLIRLADKYVRPADITVRVR